jgi:hypothetical protein
MLSPVVKLSDPKLEHRRMSLSVRLLQNRLAGCERRSKYSVPDWSGRLVQVLCCSQPDPAPKKRGTVKANANKLLPKPLRNPKTHPELLADDPHAKPAQKQPDPAQGDS